VILHKYLSPKSQIKQRSPLIILKPDRLFPTPNSDRHHTTQNPIAYSLKPNSDRPSPPKTRSPISSNIKQRSLPNHPKNPASDFLRIIGHNLFSLDTLNEA